ncbi:MAG TPA: PfkB family carbohydrate kinase [Terracidiphilus sp.]
MKEPHIILGVGELLWDIMAEERANDSPAAQPSPVSTLGGAPANFSVMAGRLGSHAFLLSRIGRDDLGRQAVDRLDPLPVDASLLEVDPTHETGRVTVSVVQGEPRYTIHQPAAWDFLELPDEWVKMAQRADAICFGSLAQRSAASRQTIQTLAAETPAACIRFFDVNLREPFYTAEILQESLQLATAVKMNAEETPVVLDLLDLAAEEEPPLNLRTSDYLHLCAERILDEFPALELVAITRGKQGSLLVKREESHEHPGFPTQVADAIGAGDAFTAALVHYMLRGASLATLNEAGNRWGSWIASQHGAMPALPHAIFSAISAAIEQTGSGWMRMNCWDLDHSLLARHPDSQRARLRKRFLCCQRSGPAVSMARL